LAVRDHPRFWEALAFLIGLIAFTIVFNFFTGFYPITLVTGNRAVSQTIVSVDSLGQLNQPPELLLPPGTIPLNATYNVQVNGQYTVFMWIIQFSNSTIHPALILEPTYVYWNTLNPASPQLYAVYVRFHFYARLSYGGWILNGTRIFISYSPTFYIPTVKGGTIGNLLQPRNATLVQTYPSVLDPMIPYSNLTQFSPRYTPDPWVVLNSPETLINGFAFGGLVGVPVGLVSWGIFAVTVHPKRDRAWKELNRMLGKAGVKRKNVPQVLLAILDAD
jgi:hypothetical protein